MQEQAFLLEKSVFYEIVFASEMFSSRFLRFHLLGVFSHDRDMSDFIAIADLSNYFVF